MKLNHLDITFEQFANEMAQLRNKKHFDYLVTIIGEDFGEEGLGCVYILENSDTYERTSVKTIARKVDDSYLIPSVCKLWKSANLLEREVFDFLGIKFLGHPDRITPGTKVVVPPLSKYGVDPSNPEHIKKAKQLGIEIYKKYQ